MTAYHRSQEGRDNISAAVRRWWQGRDRTDITDRWQRLADMQSSGMTQRAIAAQVGISQQQVCRLLQKHQRWVDRFAGGAA